jgi:hypothetical protein
MTFSPANTLVSLQLARHAHESYRQFAKKCRIGHSSMSNRVLQRDGGQSLESVRPPGHLFC